MDRRASAPQVAAIHHIIMEQREIMEHLYSESRLDEILRPASERLGAHQQQHRPDPLSALLPSVGYRGIQAFRLHRSVWTGSYRLLDHQGIITQTSHLTFHLD